MSAVPENPNIAENPDGADQQMAIAPGITRRELMYGLGGAAVIVAVGGVGRAFAGQPDALRPPGAQDYAAFVSSCIRCDRCRSVCPHDAIDVSTLEDGFIEMRLPKMNFRVGYCNGCDDEWRCIQACPTGALQPFDRTAEKIGVARINYSECQAYGASARCKYDCVAWCPTDALERADDGRLLLDEDACWGCGMCQYACPSNSYGGYDGSLARGIEVQAWEGR